MMIGALTYNVPHRKTYDTLCLLKASGYDDVVVIAEPLHYVKKFKPLIEHRPKPNNEIHPKEICRQFNYQYVEGFNDGILEQDSKILICGAGLVPQEMIKNYKLLNSHPGYLPNVRGLDALKWAIYDGQPIGVTTHRLGEEVDAGLLIDRVAIPVYPYDTFHAVSQRQYETEIRMLTEAISKIDEAVEVMSPDGFPLRKRMPHDMELKLFEKFEEMKRNSVKIDK